MHNGDDLRESFDSLDRIVVSLRPETSDWQSEGCPDSWAGMLLTQPPVRSVIFAVEAGTRDPQRLVKHVVAPEGVRIGHLVAALEGEETIFMRTAESVDTKLFLQGVILA